MEMTLTMPAPGAMNDPVNGIGSPADGGVAVDDGFDLLLAMALGAASLVPTTPAPTPAPAVEDQGVAVAGAVEQSIPSDALMVQLAPSPSDAGDAAQPAPPNIGGAGLAAQPAPPEIAGAALAAQPAPPGIIGDAVAGQLAPSAIEETTSTASRNFVTAALAGGSPPPSPSPVEGEGRLPVSPVANDQTYADRGSLSAIAASRSSEGAPGGENDAAGSKQSDARTTAAGMGERDVRAGLPEPPARVELPTDGIATLAQPAADVRGASWIHTNAAHPTAPNLVPQLVDGMRLAFQRQGSAVHLQLHPEGLGSVDLRVTSGESGLRIYIGVEDPATRDLIQAAVGQLSQTLEGRGLSVAHLLVDLATSWGGQDGAMRQRFEQAKTTGQFGATGLHFGPENDVATTEGPTAAYRIDYRV